MKISELVEVLEILKDENGDIEVCACTDDEGQFAVPVSYASVVQYNDQGGEFEALADADDDPDEEAEGVAVFLQWNEFRLP